MRRIQAWCWVALCLISQGVLRADGPADNQSAKVRPVPPPGIEIPADRKEALQQRLKEFETSLAPLRQSKDGRVMALLPDVEIFYRAVEQALKYGDLFDLSDLNKAEELIQEGGKRAASLSKGDLYWTKQTGLVVRGYRSKLDDTVQPYGMVIPEGLLADASTKRCDLWCHGRGEKMVELQFIHQRMHSVGEISPPQTFVLHPFGRYCNANKLAGEVDTLESLEHAQKSYPIDADRIAIRGFSMGGAAAWHLAVHYPDKWFAANPGAGFSETPDFLKVFQNETLTPTWYEQKLWQMYDCNRWARNIRMVPTIAYSGDRDTQKQAADLMAKACAELDSEPFELTHIIGPNTAHSIHPDAKIEIERRLAILAKHPYAPVIDGKFAPLEFVTTTLKYNRCRWLTVNGLEEHWRPARVSAYKGFLTHLAIGVENVTDFSLDLDPYECPNLEGVVSIYIFDLNHPYDLNHPDEDRSLEIRLQSDHSAHGRFRFEEGKWRVVSPREPEPKLRKRHNLQGPIDDAFMDSFLFVKPSQKCQHEKVDQWVQAEFERAIVRWRRQMRGEPRVKLDKDVTPQDIEKHHLVLWGDRKANELMAKVAPQLPIRWQETDLVAGEKKFAAETHVPLLIYPNPLNPHRYVVLNSGFTYREYDDLNNARQVPKLPDWAIVDVTTAPDSRYPGKVVDANFFGEDWLLKQ